ncbi:MAG TPA: hypothetical protein IAC38_04220 [Candidatus Caccovivens faecavium]|nr:hypothetical protein [Candidatus Caccovivens faecavium]
MKDLLKSNIYDCSDEIIIVGSCLKAMQPKAFEEIENMNLPIFEICLEQTHINMAITKILGMIRANKIRRIVFASVDKSPHCIQLHYIQDEIRKLGFELSFENYVAVNNALIKISKETITLSKNLSELSLVNYR